MVLAIRNFKELTPDSESARTVQAIVDIVRSPKGNREAAKRLAAIALDNFRIDKKGFESSFPDELANFLDQAFKLDKTNDQNNFEQGLHSIDPKKINYFYDVLARLSSFVSQYIFFREIEIDPESLENETFGEYLQEQAREINSEFKLLLGHENFNFNQLQETRLANILPLLDLCFLNFYTIQKALTIRPMIAAGAVGMDSPRTIEVKELFNRHDTSPW